MFVCFEGIDGAGKSTQALMLARALETSGVRAEVVADPGTTQIGTAIRQILLKNDAPISEMAQMLLFSAARAELSQYIKNRLTERAGVVICDRWILSSLVYQNVLNKIDTEAILTVYHLSQPAIPDVCFVLDIPPKAARSRMGEPGDRYERRSMSDCKLLRERYLDLAAKNHAKFTYVINAEKPIDVTAEKIKRILFALQELRSAGIESFDHLKRI